MAITAHKLRRCEIWSTWVAGGGVRQAIVDDATVLTATSNIAGSDNLDLTLPLVSAAAPYVVPNAVIRVEESDGVFDEWLILEGPNDDDGNGLRAVKALSVRAAMAKCEFVRRIDSDGVSVLDFESVGLTPAQQIAAWVVPALTRGGMGWVVAGTITPTKLLDLTFASDTPLSVLQRIAEQTGMELEVRRTGDTGYAIDIIAEIGSAQPTADLRFDKNLQPGTKRNRSSLESATRVYPIGADEDGRRATMSRATWLVTNIAGLIVTLADPAGGAGPIQFDGQLAGADGTTAAYLRKPNGTLTAVTASSFANQTVTVASAANLAINDLAQFRADSAGADLLWLDSPPDRALYGLSVGKVEMSDVPSTNNLLKNAVMRNWPGSPTSPPTNWTTVGGGTVARQAASPYTRSGGFSIHRVGVADGDGVISDAVPISPTALRPYISGYAGLWVVSGQVRVELVFTTGGGPVVLPLPPDFATNSVLAQWVDLGLAGIDANALGATAVAIRVVQHGATAADFYLDYGQVTESGSQLPLAESSGGTRLWQAANEALRTSGAPLVSYAMQIVDLANIDAATWGADCKVQVGGKVRVTDPRLSIAITTRLVEMVRDYRVPGDTRITLSNKPDDLTGAGARPSSPPRAPAEPSELLTAPALRVLNFREIERSTTTITLGWTVPAAVEELWLWLSTQALPVSSDPWAALTGAPTARLSGDTTTYTVPIPPPGTITYGRLIPIGANAERGQAWDFTLQGAAEGEKYTSCIARITSSDATTVTVTVEGLASVGTPTVQYVEVLGSATKASGPAVGVPSPSETVWVFNRGVINGGVGQARFRSVFSGYENDDDLVTIEEQGRDTIPLILEARPITGAPADYLRVRIAVADPFPQGANTINVTLTLLGLPGPVYLAGTTTDFGAGRLLGNTTALLATAAFVDVDIPQPAFGGAGRVSMRATAPNRTQAIDAVDVPAIDSDFSTTSFVASAGITLGGNNAVKTTGTAAWDEQVYSKDGYTGGAYASATSSGATDVLFGLNTDPTTDASYASVDYAFVPRASAALDILESGASAGTFGTWAVGDVLAVTYDGSNIRYLKNGTVLRTVAVGAGIKFFFDSSFNGNVALNNIRFGPMSSNNAGDIGPGGLDPDIGVDEGGAIHKFYRHREEITFTGPDADGDVATTFAQTYQNVPMVLFNGGQFVTFSETLGTGAGAQHRLRIQALNVTASGMTSRTQITNVGATTPQTDDFAAGTLTGTQSSPGIGNTKEADLNPAGANDDTYTVHFDVFVEAVNAGGAHFADLDIAIETNDGGGWVPRATRNYNVGTTSAGTHNDTWEEDIPITVSGIGLNDDIRVRIVDFDVTGQPGATGSYTITFESPGVTYTTATDTTESAIPATGDQATWVAQEVT